MSLVRYIYLFLLVTCVVGCDNPSDKIARAARLVGERPDSAYAILRDVDYNDLDDDSLKARYILTKGLADIRLSRSLVTDTLLDKAAAYYISAGDTTDWVITSQLLSGYDFMKGDAEAARQRLDDMIPVISNRELLWDIYLNVLEVSINSGDYANAGDYADWLLRNTDLPEQTLTFATAKSAAQYMLGNSTSALAVLDSIIATGIPGRVRPEISQEFHLEYAGILDGAGKSSKAIAVIDSLIDNGAIIDNVERRLSLALFHANSGDTDKAMTLLDSINIDGTQPVFEIYASTAMLKAALQYKMSGRFPSELMHKVSKNIHRSYRFARFDLQTAMESVMELNDDNYELKLQRQRLRMLVTGISLLLVISGMAVYIIMSRRKRNLIESEERAETLERMLKDYEKDGTGSSNSDKLKAALLHRLGIFKAFAGTPTQQSRDALKKISTVGNVGAPIESLVDWPEFYTMIDDLYDGFHSKLIKKYPGTFNDKEQQIIVLLKAGFSTKEIGVLTEQSSATIYTRKSVIRKKLGTPENGDFIAQLEERNATG